jgi:septin family protein
MFHLIDQTHRKHYENFRNEKLVELSTNGNAAEFDLTNVEELKVCLQLELYPNFRI